MPPCTIKWGWPTAFGIMTPLEPPMQGGEDRSIFMPSMLSAALHCTSVQCMWEMCVSGSAVVLIP